MLTAVATGNVFVLLPIVGTSIKQMIKDKGLDSEERRVILETIVPVSFNFPLGGSILILLFIPFAGWFYGSNLELIEYLELISTGILALFGGSVAAILFLLNYFHIPVDILEFFVAFNVVNDRLAALCSAVYQIAFCVLCVAWLTGFLKINLRKIIKNSIIIFIASIFSLVACAIYLDIALDKEFKGDEILSKMQIKNTVQAKVFKQFPNKKQLKNFKSDGKMGRLELIKKRGTLRVGYSPYCRPFSYINSAGDLVGYDVEKANLLAKDLGCTLEFIPMRYDNIDRGMADGIVDIVMAGVSITLKRIKYLHFSDPYMQINLAFITKDYRKDDFSFSDDIRNNNNLLIASEPGVSYREHMKSVYPNLKFIEIANPDDYFSGKIKADALLSSAEEGYAWCLSNPAFCVVIPRPEVIKENLAYVLPKGDIAFSKYINHWLRVRETDGVTEKLYNYWVLGKNIQKKEKRWCLWDEFFVAGKESCKIDKNWNKKRE